MNLEADLRSDPMWQGQLQSSSVHQEPEALAGLTCPPKASQLKGDGAEI